MAYYKQPCDSYFTESHGDHGARLREEVRERDAHLKRQTQLAIAEDLSQLAGYEYGDCIQRHMEHMENKTLPDVTAIEIQTEIQWFMRPYLIDFLIEAHGAFALLPETLFLTVNLLDRYCSRRIVYRKHYQLVGCCALLVAAKYGDRKDRVPTIKELKAMCCALYEDDMFTQMEWHVLQTVDWLIGHPTVDNFLQLALDNLPYDPEVGHMACFISEIAMFYKEFVSIRPSDMARSSLALARFILGRAQASNDEWASKYEYKTLYSLSQQLHRPSSSLSRKYSTAHLSRVSITLEDFLTRQASIIRCYPPPTPPAETCVEETRKQQNQENIPVTPTKPYFMTQLNNGCPTPPITPTNQEPFAGPTASMSMGNTYRPPTPISMTSQPSINRHGAAYSLPPISQIAPML